MEIDCGFQFSTKFVIIVFISLEDLEMSASHFRAGSRRLQRKLWWQNVRVSERCLYSLPLKAPWREADNHGFALSTYLILFS